MNKTSEKRIRIFSVLLCMILTLNLLMPSMISAAVVAKYAANEVVVNGKTISFAAYNIGGANYFKLRDLAYVLSGTEKQFSVGWDGEKNAISLTSGKSYTAVGGELTIPEDKGDKTANETRSEIYLNGEKVAFAAYSIGGANYFKLRDVMKTFDVGLTWSSEQGRITLSSAGNYIEDKPSEEKPAENGALTAEQISEKISPSVVYVEVYDQNGAAIVSGSGVVIGSEKVVTNYHVIEKAVSVKVKTASGTMYSCLGMIGTDGKNDLAMMKVPNLNVPAVALGNSDQLKAGQTIYTLGSPEGLENTIASGIISNSARIMDGYALPLVQITAPISSGSSGGALLSNKGELIGITCGAIEGGQNLNFAVPVNGVKNMTETAPMSFPAAGVSPGRPQTPKNVSLKKVDDDTIAVTCDPVAGADGYYIYYGDTENDMPYYFEDDAGRKELKNFDGDGYLGYISGCAGSTTCFKITAVKNGKESDFSATKSMFLPPISSGGGGTSGGSSGGRVYEREMNDIPEYANPLPKATLGIGHISYGSDSMDFYRITVTKGGFFAAYLTPEYRSDVFDLRLVLADRNGDSIEFSSYENTGKYEAQAIYMSYLGPGEYYLCAWAKEPGTDSYYDICYFIQ